MFKDSHTRALEWEAANPQRALELNDMLDACVDLEAQRELYASLPKDEKDGLMPEYARRGENRRLFWESFARLRYQRWYVECGQCDDGKLSDQTRCFLCKGTGRVVGWQLIPCGSLVRLTYTEQPAPHMDPWSIIQSGARAYEGGLALVLGNRIDQINTESDAWQGHDTLCWHQRYNLCWLPSKSLEIIGEAHT